MDQKDLGLARYDAGKEYLSSLRALKLEPEALFWAYDLTLEQFVLVLVTSLFDYAGPLALTEVLFEAYNVAATPKDVDPFIVRLHSPNQAIYKIARPHIGNRIDLAGLKGAALDRSTIAGQVEPFAVIKFSAGDLVSFGTWCYKSTPKPRPKNADAERRWSRFSNAVHKLAA